MPYQSFDASLPDGSTQNGAQVLASVRSNQAALRDAIAAGVMFGWAMTPSGGTASEPAVITYSKSTDRVRATLTWSGGKVTEAVYDFSANAGGAWDAIGTQTIAYDANDNVTGVTWS